MRKIVRTGSELKRYLAEEPWITEGIRVPTWELGRCATKELFTFFMVTPFVKDVDAGMSDPPEFYNGCKTARGNEQVIPFTVWKNM